MRTTDTAHLALKLTKTENERRKQRKRSVSAECNPHCDLHYTNSSAKTITRGCSMLVLCNSPGIMDSKARGLMWHCNMHANSCAVQNQTCDGRLMRENKNKVFLMQSACIKGPKGFPWVYGTLWYSQTECFAAPLTEQSSGPFVIVPGKQTQKSPFIKKPTSTLQSAGFRGSL